MHNNGSHYVFIVYRCPGVRPSRSTMDRKADESITRMHLRRHQITAGSL